MAFINFKPTDFFNSLLYTGNGGGTQAQTGLGFQPDITWIKCRSGAESHVIGNSVRGGNKYVYTNANTLEGSLTTYLKSFDADGFTVGSGGFVGSNNATYVGWNWKCGTTSGVSGGSITPLGYSFNAWKGLYVEPNYSMGLKEDENGEREGTFNLGLAYRF